MNSCHSLLTRERVLTVSQLLFHYLKCISFTSTLAKCCCALLASLVAWPISLYTYHLLYRAEINLYCFISVLSLCPVCQFGFKKSETCRKVCTKTYNTKNPTDNGKLDFLKKGMLLNYQHHWYVTYLAPYLESLAHMPLPQQLCVCVGLWTTCQLPGAMMLKRGRSSVILVSLLAVMLQKEGGPKMPVWSMWVGHTNIKLLI